MIRLHRRTILTVEGARVFLLFWDECSSARELNFGVERPMLSRYCSRENIKPWYVLPSHYHVVFLLVVT